MYLETMASFKASNSRDLNLYLKEGKKHLPRGSILIVDYNYIWKTK